MDQPDRTYLPGRVGFADEHDIDEFIATLSRYERGELDADAWRRFRLVRGVYGQRQPDVQMLRVKIPEGVLTAAGLRALADVLQRYGDGLAHVTSRQNVQMYGLRLGQMEGAMRDLAAVGLTTREACGNSVRNVTACPLAGVDPEEVFDVTPYADALTRYLLRGPRSSDLPRKFKIAFEGCHRGCVVAGINDLAYLARRDADGRPGFLVLAGGGTSTLNRTAKPLVEFLPAGEILAVAEAVVRVFHREGERKNKHKARLKWLIEKLGWDAFAERVRDELRLLREQPEGLPRLPFDPDAPPSLPEPPLPTAGGRGLAILEPGFDAWRRTNVRSQKQTGFVAATVTLRMGDLHAPELRGLADLSEELADGQVRTTPDQNLVLRFVAEGKLPTLYRRLQQLGLAAAGAGTFADVGSCPGADTCAIAVTASRGMGGSLAGHLAERAASLEAGLDGARIKISGCPNGCGQHHIAAIGLQGGLRKVGGRPVPVYHLYIGGAAEETPGGPATARARFGRLAGKLPARRGPQALERLLGLWRRERVEGEPLTDFLARVTVEAVQRELADLLHIDEKQATPEDFIDIGQRDAFTVGEGESECAA